LSILRVSIYNIQYTMDARLGAASDWDVITYRSLGLKVEPILWQNLHDFMGLTKSALTESMKLTKAADDVITSLKGFGSHEASNEEFPTFPKKLNRYVARDAGKLARYISLAGKLSSLEAPVDLMVSHTFSVVGYDDTGDFVISAKENFDFTLQGKKVSCRPDVNVRTIGNVASEINIVVSEKKKADSSNVEVLDAEAQGVAEILAAEMYNMKQQLSQHDTFVSYPVFMMVVVGTKFSFYKSYLTQQQVSDLHNTGKCDHGIIKKLIHANNRSTLDIAYPDERHTAFQLLSCIYEVCVSALQSS